MGARGPRGGLVWFGLVWSKFFLEVLMWGHEGWFGPRGAREGSSANRIDSRGRRTARELIVQSKICYRIMTWELTMC